MTMTITDAYTAKNKCTGSRHENWLGLPFRKKGKIRKQKFMYSI